MVDRIARDVKQAHEAGTEICMVVGGGNIFRGMKAATDWEIDRASADYMGMLATVINAMAMQAMRLRISAAASSMRSNGPPKAKQSSLSCAMAHRPRACCGAG